MGNLVRSKIKKKIILLLAAGLVLSLTPSPRKHGYILRSLSKEWRKINRQYLYRVIHEFKYKRIIDWREDSGGLITITLSEKGKKVILRFNIDKMEIPKPLSWDKKWRIVFFDIPEKKRGIRDALRRKLKELDFYEIQKSVFIHPYPCLPEVKFVIEFFEARPYVRYGEITNLINEEELKLFFELV